jgi:sortase (surface protein transpeptidase)
MTWVSPPEPPRPGPRRWWVATAVLVLVGACSVVVGVQGNHRALVDTPESQRPNYGITAAPTSAPVPAVSRSVPVELRVPAIGLAVPLSGLGLNPDRTVEVPTDFQRPGWFELGPSPGQLGSAVILGHVDSFRGPAVFFRLRTLQKGDEVSVALADGAVTRFVVTEVVTYLKEAFPAELVYGSRGSSALQLVTCGGEFDPVARSYRSNVVAFTSLVSTTAAR